MTSKLFVLLFISLGFFNVASASPVCVKNGKELAQFKDSFPRFLQTQQELQFARSETPVAYIKVSVGPSKIAGEAKYKIPIFGIKQEKGYATELCYDKQSRELTIELDNGSDFKVKVINDNPPDATITIKGYELTRKPAEFNKAIATLNGTSRSAPPAPAPASSQGNGGAR